MKQFLRSSAIAAALLAVQLATAAPNKQIVCLIEGKIEVTPPNKTPIVTDQALQFYVRENERSLPVGRVDPNQLKQWALQTDIEAGKGATHRGGKWKVVAASVEGQDDALEVYDALRANCHAAEIQPAMSGEKRIYNVRLSHLPSKAEAEALAGSLRGKMGVGEPKVSI